jgi:hypothetical protein
MNKQWYIENVKKKIQELGGTLVIEGSASDISSVIGPIEKMSCDNVMPDMSVIFRRFISPLRFFQGIEMLEKIAQKNWQVLEVGSCFPWLSFPFITSHNWNVKTVDILVFKNHFEHNLSITYGNLCTDDFGFNQYDLVIATEVLEHLPCDILEVKEKLLKCLKNNGYLFVSFPLSGDTSLDSMPLISSAYHGHIRSFSENGINNLFKDLTEIERQRITLDYNHLQLLYKKEVKQ